LAGASPIRIGEERQGGRFPGLNRSTVIAHATRYGLVPMTVSTPAPWAWLLLRSLHPCRLIPAPDETLRRLGIMDTVERPSARGETVATYHKAQYA
jgi:hypothetical protein